MSDLPDRQSRSDPPPGSSRGVLIAHESTHGRAPRAAAAMARAARDLDREPVVRLMDQVLSADIANAERLLVGGWVRTWYPFGGATIDHALEWI